MGWSLAIDFGTTFTTTALSVEGRIELVEIEGSRYFPSLVCLDGDDRLLVGREALNEAGRRPSRCERWPKRALATADHVRLGGHTFETIELAAVVLRRVAGEAAKGQQGPPDAVVLTHPARWAGGGVELTRLARAATRAGLVAPVFVAEPVAVAHHYVHSSGEGLVAGTPVAVYDFGGGSFDAAVLRQGDGGLELAGLPGGDEELAGEDLDAVLTEVVTDHAEASDPERWARLWDDSDDEGHGDRLLLRATITRAKETLSFRTAVDVELPGFGSEVRLTRREYEAAVDPLLERSVAEFAKMISRSGTSPASLAGVFLSGGTSRTPRITTLLSAMLGALPTVEDDPKAVVVRGALEVITHPLPGAARGRAITAPPPAADPAPSGPDGHRPPRRPVPREGVLVVVTGGPKAGKTSVVNALLGAEVLPYGRLPCRNPSVLVRWGERPGGLLYRSSNDQPDWFALDRLSDRASAGPANDAPFYVDVVYSSELLREVMLIDCVAEEDLEPNAERRGRVHVVDVTAPTSFPPSTAVPELLVLTKLDLVAADERDARREAVLEPWRRVHNDIAHVVANAPRALRALGKRNVASYVSSGGAALLHAVRRMV
ncbi:Hsp70 family protein [Actinomycetospora atypica]|uniref:Hsp70 family protein n=1 Tax=Actinomycetospora atypica TaxID=1290095 RepID=A0ABV9YM70_9PSEU